MMDEKEDINLWIADPRNQIVSKPLKRSLLCLAFTCWVLGGLFAAFGGMRINFTAGQTFAKVAYGAFAALGCYIFVISSFGLAGALRENLCLLRTYKNLLAITLALQLIAGLVGFAMWPEVKKTIDKSIRFGIKHYYDDEKFEGFMDGMQRGVGCCGSLTIDDWDSNPYFRCKFVGSYRSCGVPWSCCLRKFHDNLQCGYKIRKTRYKGELPRYINTIGCLDKLFEMMRSNMYLIGGVAVGTIVVLLSGIMMSHRLMIQIKKTIVKFNEANDKYGWNQAWKRAEEAEEMNNDSEQDHLMSNTTYY